MNRRVRHYLSAIVLVIVGVHSMTTAQPSVPTPPDTAYGARAEQLRREAQADKQYAADLRRRAAQYRELAQRARETAGSSTGAAKEIWNDTARRHENDGRQLAEMAQDFERRALAKEAQAAAERQKVAETEKKHSKTPPPPKTSAPPKPPPPPPPPRAKAGPDTPAVDAQFAQTFKATAYGIASAPVRTMGVCGPDVSAGVIRLLRKIHDDFEAAPDKQEAACDALVGIRTGEYAWDITEFSPFEAMVGALPSKESPRGRPSMWERLSGFRCCQPRYPCGPTVEFFGACHNAQVVNYVQWGMTISLCDRFATKRSQQELVQWVRNRNSPDRREQEVMTRFGLEYGEMLKRSATSDLKIVDAALGDLIRDNDVVSDRIHKACDTACTTRLTSKIVEVIDGWNYAYRWVGLNEPAR